MSLETRLNLLIPQQDTSLPVTEKEPVIPADVKLHRRRIDAALNDDTQLATELNKLNGRFIKHTSTVSLD